LGHEITIASTGKAAIAELARSNFDLILCELHLQSESAFDFLQATRSTDSARNTPFVFCCVKPGRPTRTMAEGMEVSSKALGADALLVLDEYNDPALKALLKDYENQKRSGNPSQT
jgi:CheY-like chemotaxis protein